MTSFCTWSALHPQPVSTPEVRAMTITRLSARAWPEMVSLGYGARASPADRNGTAFLSHRPRQRGFG
jgi:hypothetical protein